MTIRLQLFLPKLFAALLSHLDGYLCPPKFHAYCSDHPAMTLGD